MNVVNNGLMLEEGMINVVGPVSEWKSSGG